METLFFKEQESIVFISLNIIAYFINKKLFILSLFVTGFLIFFYRIPDIKYLNDSSISSPCSGKIIKIEENPDSYKLYIFMSILDHHVQIIPVSGKITKYEFIEGEFQLAYNLEEDNYITRFITEISNEHGVIEIIQNTGLIARRIKNFHRLNKNVEKGELLGIIKFGSRIDITIPKPYHLNVKLNDIVTIGNSLAKLSKINL